MAARRKGTNGKSKDSEPVTTQLLIYERARPISKAKHGNWSVKLSDDFSFARHINSVPLTSVEFAPAAAEYAIVFAGTEDEVMPIVLLGAREDQNAFVGEDGKWDARYVPAFIRRYPFVFSLSEDEKTFIACIDEEFSGCNQDGVGERLFDTEGNVLNFLNAYQTQFLRTQEFCKRLVELELLETMQAQIKLEETQELLNLTGFKAISRDKLKQLDGKTLAELAKTDELELAYLHLQSMNNVGRMAERLAP